MCGQHRPFRGGRLCYYELRLAGCHVDDMTELKVDDVKESTKRTRPMEAKKKKIDKARPSTNANHGPAERQKSSRVLRFSPRRSDARWHDQRETVGYEYDVYINSKSSWRPKDGSPSPALYSMLFVTESDTTCQSVKWIQIQIEFRTIYRLWKSPEWKGGGATIPTVWWTISIGFLLCYS